LASSSGVNLTGTYNVDNATTVDPPPAQLDSAVAAADGDAYDVYARFWSVQAFFANPRACLDAVGWVRLLSVRRRAVSMQVHVCLCLCRCV
jgi:hypothetical protein